MASTAERLARYRGHLSVAAMALKSGDYHAATRNLQEAFQEVEDAGIRLDSDELRQLYHLAGKIYTNTQRYEEAEQAFKKALELNNKGLEDANRWSDCRHLAEVYRLQGKYGQSRSLHEKCLGELQKSGDAIALAKTFRSLGLVHLESGNLDEAERSIESALALFERELGARSFWFARCLITLARIRFAQGRREECKKLLGDSLQIIEPLVGPHHPLRALALDRLAKCLSSSGDGESAGEIMAEVRRIDRFISEHDT